MRIKILFLIGGIFCLSIQLKAQNEPVYGYFQDALRFSQNRPYTSARMMGLSNATTALGADVSVAGFNPAGLGLLRKSEISTSLFNNNELSKSNFWNQNVQTNSNTFRIGQFGIALNSLKDAIEPGSYRGGTFAVNYSRQNLFNSTTRMEGTNPYRTVNNVRVPNSIVDYYLDQLNTSNTTPNEIFAGDYSLLPYNKARVGQAYGAYILDTFPSNQGGLEFATNFPAKYDARQQVSIQTKGRINQWDFSYGGNFNDNFYIGLGFGLVNVDYSNKVTYLERIGRVYDVDPQPGATEYFQKFTGTSIENALTQSVSGTGLNFKLGFIYKISDLMRVGAAITTPTNYALKETYSEDLQANYNGLPYWKDTQSTLGNYKAKTLLSEFTYGLRTPWKYALGASFFINKSGFISVDADYLAFDNMNLTGSGSENLIGDNNEIKKVYRSVINFRIGGEFRHEIFRFRGGFGYNGDPYVASGNDGLNRSNVNISLGAGIKMEDYYVDVALNNTTFRSRYAFNTSYSAFGQIRNTNTMLMVTFGLPF